MNCQKLFTSLVFALGLIASAAVAGAAELTLNEAIQTALRRNPTVQAAQLQATAGAWSVGEAAAGWLPRLSFDSSWSRPDDQTYDDADQQYQAAKRAGSETERTLWRDNYSSSLVASQPIFNGGAEYCGLRIALSQREAARFAAADARLQAIRDVTVAFFGVQQTEALWKAAKETLAWAKESLALYRKRFELGQSASPEVLRWEAEEAQAESDLAVAENDYRQALMDLAQAIGLPPSEAVVLPPAEERIDAKSWQRSAEILAAAEPATAAWDRHPLRRQQQETTKQAEIQHWQGIGSFLPSVNATFQYNWATNDTLALDDRTSWTAGVGVEIPLFQGLKALSGERKTAAELQARRWTENAERWAFQRRGQAAFLQLKSARLRIVASERAREQAKANQDLVRQRLQVGLDANLQLLDAQKAYRTAQAGLIQAVGDFQIALAEWDYVTAVASGD
ncbi:MAG: TolC family protein [Myxococcales bacterium]|nr:TolC family protein [Myxococcales bacterium]